MEAAYFPTYWRREAQTGDSTKKKIRSNHSFKPEFDLNVVHRMQRGRVSRIDSCWDTDGHRPWDIAQIQPVERGRNGRTHSLVSSLLNKIVEFLSLHQVPCSIQPIESTFPHNATSLIPSSRRAWTLEPARPNSTLYASSASFQLVILVEEHLRTVEGCVLHLLSLCRMRLLRVMSTGRFEVRTYSSWLLGRINSRDLRLMNNITCNFLSVHEKGTELNGLRSAVVPSYARG